MDATLLTWLGTKDLDNMLNDTNAAISILATKPEQPFDKIVILSNKDEDKWSHFERFLKKRMAIINRPNQDIQVHKAHINSPIDYQSIAKVFFNPADTIEAEALAKAAKKVKSSKKLSAK